MDYATAVKPLPPRVSAIDPELVTLFMEETKQPRRIVEGFLTFDLEPPHRDKTTLQGFNGFERRVLDETRYTEPDPLDEDPTADLHDPRAEARAAAKAAKAPAKRKAKR